MLTSGGIPMARTKAAAKPDASRQLAQVKRVSSLLKQVSNETRIQLILMLSEGERHVSGLSEELTMSQPAVSHHLALLRFGGIISPRRQGKNTFYSLTEAGKELARVVKRVVG
jgi:DNA-binding transcriptional ArsR family regulator